MSDDQHDPKSLRTIEERDEISDDKKKRGPKPWRTVELPGHAIWEVKARTNEEAIQLFVEHHHIKATKQEYKVHEGRVRDELIRSNKRRMARLQRQT